MTAMATLEERHSVTAEMPCAHHQDSHRGGHADGILSFAALGTGGPGRGGGAGLGRLRRTAAGDGDSVDVPHCLCGSLGRTGRCKAACASVS